MSNSLKAANMLARAATDAQFRSQLMADPKRIAAESGVKIHEHAGYAVLEDTAGLRNIVVTDQAHGQVGVEELRANPGVAEIRRWAIGHVQAGDATGDAIRSDVNAAIAAAGATPPNGMEFHLAVDDPDTMHMVIPFAGASAVGLSDAETFAGAGTEVTQTNTVQTAEAITTEAVDIETSVGAAAEVGVAAVEVEVEVTSTTTSIEVEVEVVVVPGFIT